MEEDFFNDDMKDELRKLVGKFGRPLTEAEKRKWLHGIDDDEPDEVGVDDMLNLMTGQPTVREQSNAFAEEMDITPKSAEVLQNYYHNNKYSRPKMDTNWRSLDYLKRATGLPQAKIIEVLKLLRSRD
ncbi:MAG: hypothetical protein ACPG8W_16975 [Candidatus Promineifilaceae bacterium]